VVAGLYWLVKRVTLGNLLQRQNSDRNEAAKHKKRLYKRFKIKSYPWEDFLSRKEYNGRNLLSKAKKRSHAFRISSYVISRESGGFANLNSSESPRDHAAF